MKQPIRTILSLAVAGFVLSALAAGQTDIGTADQASLEKVHSAHFAVLLSVDRAPA